MDKICVCVHKQSSYQPIMQITRGTEKIKFMVLVKKAVQQVVEPFEKINHSHVTVK